MELKARANLSKENGNTHNLPSSQEDEYKKRIAELENMVRILNIIFMYFIYVLIKIYSNLTIHITFCLVDIESK